MWLLIPCPLRRNLDRPAAVKGEANHIWRIFFWVPAGLSCAAEALAPDAGHWIRKPQENPKKIRRLIRRVFPRERAPMSLSSAKNFALRAERSQDPKEAADLLAKAILELAASIEATDAKVKKINKSGG
jgi:hypothetical protein